MSDTATPTTETTPPEIPVEKPFNIDVLLTCTARMTRKAWDILLTFQKQGLEKFQTVPVRAVLMSRTAEGIEPLVSKLKEAGVTEISTNVPKVQNYPSIEFTGTFAQIQQVIKLPETYMLNITKQFEYN